MERKTFESKVRSVVNTTLLLSGGVMAGSGLLLQCHYHLLKSPCESMFLALNRVGWNTVHVWASFVFLVAVICHIRAHRKWYAQVLKRNLTTKTRVTIILTLLFALVAITGVIPLLIRCFESDSGLRIPIIEIHDKIAILFFVFALGHAVKRFRSWK